MASMLLWGAGVLALASTACGAAHDVAGATSLTQGQTAPAAPDGGVQDPSVPMVGRTNEPRKAQARESVVDRCNRTRVERIEDVKKEIAEWVKDSKAIQKGGGLAWYARHCQRGVDQFGELMAPVCNAKLPPGGTRATVDTALDRIVDLNDRGSSGVANYIYVTRANFDCFDADGHAGGHLLFRRDDPTALLQSFVDMPSDATSAAPDTTAAAPTIPTPTKPKR